MTNPQQLLANATQQLNTNNPAQAIATCRLLLEQYPGLPEGVNLLAIALSVSGQTNQAIAELQSALVNHPESSLLLSTLAELYLTIANLDEAEQVLQRALSLSPQHIITNIVMAKLYIGREQHDKAEATLRHALVLQKEQGQDHLFTYFALSELLMPGRRYKEILAQFHQWLKPASYLEIGVETGATLALALAETTAIGVDPQPIINVALPPKAQVFALESDHFFAQQNLIELIAQPTLDMAFIDGLHVFEQALRDFINVERFCRRDSVVLVHDCLPLDEVSSHPNRTTNFWSGDPWKVMAVLRKYRPDLCCFTIPTQPTGLGVITGLDANNRILSDRFDEIVAEYQEKDYQWLEQQGLNETLGVFVNDWPQITSRISAAQQ